MGGLLPAGPGDVNPNAKYGYTGNNGSISGAAGRTQDVVTRELKQDFYDNDFGTNDPWDGIDMMPQGPLLWSVLNAIARSALALPGEIWEDINQLFDALGWLPQQITEHTEAIANLEDVRAAMNTTPAYVGDLQDMVSVARSSVTILGGNLSTYADIDDIDEPRHKPVCPTIRPSYTFSSSWGDIYYVPVVADRYAVVDKFRWITGADTSILSINFYEAALCVYNPDTLAFEKVWSSGDIKDTYASVSGKPREVEIDMGILQDCTPGQILVGAFQQTAPGPGQTTRRLGVAPLGGVERPASVAPLDAPTYVAELHTQGIPSTIAVSSLVKVHNYVPWVAIKVSAHVEETP